MNIIETSNLSYSFNKENQILKDINLQVPEGVIYGFLGKNGAGKTTTLKLLLGLLKKQNGSITFFNEEFATNRIEILSKVGSLIEAPSFYAHLSAVDNLKVLQKIYKCSNERLEEVLNIVGLANTGKKKAGRFSLGMKQRLSIGIALLNDPKILILDEPTNGLDPNGIIDIRELLVSINQKMGTTIIISSHLLSEIEKIITYVGIIDDGKLLFQGTFDELRSKQSSSISTTFETSDNAKAGELITAMGLDVTFENGSIRIEQVNPETIARINKNIIENQIDLYGVYSAKRDLENIFMNLINN